MNMDIHLTLCYHMVCLSLTSGFVTQCYLTICLYCLMLLLSVTQLNFMLQLDAVALLSLPLPFSSRTFSIRTVSFLSLCVTLLMVLVHGFTAPAKLKPNMNPGWMMQLVLSDVSAVKLNMSFQMLRDCWRHYQRTVREAKRKHFPDIIFIKLSQASCVV